MIQLLWNITVHHRAIKHICMFGTIPKYVQPPDKPNQRQRWLSCQGAPLYKSASMQLTNNNKEIKMTMINNIFLMIIKSNGIFMSFLKWWSRPNESTINNPQTNQSLVRRTYLDLPREDVWNISNFILIFEQNKDGVSAILQNIFEEYLFLLIDDVDQMILIKA